MNYLRTVGIVLTVSGVVGYAIGTVEAYPGRSAAIVGVMVGVTFCAIGRSVGEGTGE